MDAVSMFDDEIMEAYLGGEEVPRTKIRRPSARPPSPTRWSL